MSWTTFPLRLVFPAHVSLFVFYRGRILPYPVFYRGRSLPCPVIYRAPLFTVPRYLPCFFIYRAPSFCLCLLGGIGQPVPAAGGGCVGDDVHLDVRQSHGGGAHPHAHHSRGERKNKTAVNDEMMNPMRVDLR